MKKILFFLLLFSQCLFSQTLFEKAEKLFKDKKYTEAKGLFESYLKSVPNHQKTIEYLGDIAGNSKKWDIAIDYYKKLKNQNPNSANYWFKYGGAMGMKAKSVNKFKAVGMIDDIENAFLTAATLDKKHIETRWALVILYIELPGIIGGSEKKSIKYADELLAISKVDGYLAKGYIDVYYKRYKSAEVNLLKAHQIGKSATTYAKLYDLYLNKLKDKAKALNLKK
ncbi:MAG: tetratricopeptide repeat protein [Bacteroidota bacterium]